MPWSGMSHGSPTSTSSTGGTSMSEPPYTSSSVKVSNHLAANLPPDQRRPPRQASAEAAEEHELAAAEPAGGESFIEGERNGARRSVAVTIHVIEDFFVWNLQPLVQGLIDDTDVRLVHHVE